MKFIDVRRKLWHIWIFGDSCAHTHAHVPTQQLVWSWTPHYCSTPGPLLLISIIPADGKTIIIPRVSRKPQTGSEGWKGSAGEAGAERERAQVTVHFH